MQNIQELAKAISKISWAGVQSDNPEDNEAFHFLKTEVLKLDKCEAVSLLFEVMEAQQLNWAYPHTVFSELLSFSRMSQAYTSFVPGDDTGQKDKQTDDWYDLCIKLDAMARYRDNKHFGLPMGQIFDLIGTVASEFTLTKNKQ